MHATDDSRPRLARSRRPRRAWALLPVTLLLAAGLSACTEPGEGPAGPPLTAGNGTCELPWIKVEPSKVKAGEKVHVTGEWFVVGCGGQSGLSPQTFIGVSFTSAKGDAQGLYAVDATGPTGKIDVQVEIPADAPQGRSKITVGPAAPVSFMVES